METMEKERRNPKTSVLLPTELKEEILQYLHVKSLVRFKSVSKQWRSMIESNYFIKKHRCSFSNPKFIVVKSKTTYHHESQDHEKYSTTLFLETFARDDHRGENDTQISRFTCPYTFQDPITEDAPFNLTKDVGSCDGLVCIQDSSIRNGALATNVYIINPATRKQYGRGIYRSPVCMGFGKDMVTETYKTIFLYRSKSLDDDHFETSVLTLGNGEKQRRIDDFPFSNVGFCHKQPSVFANGSVFWLSFGRLGSKPTIELVALDLHTEKFRRVSWPSWYVEHFSGMRLWSLEDRLCLSDVKDYPNVDVWSLKKMEDLSEQWEKIFVIDIPNIDRLDIKFWMSGLQAEYGWSREEIPLAKRNTTLYRETLVSPYPSI